ncbi:MAG: hypothetical protein ACR2QC_01120 [Gammaproteobacteria bacterium]
MESKFRFSASPFLFVLFAAAGASAVAGVLSIIAIPPPPRILAAAAIATAFVFAVRRHALLRGRGAARAAAFLPGGEVEITAADGVHRGRLRSVSVAPWLAVFVAECGGRRFNVLAAFDCMPKDSHRQLRVRLRTATVPPPAGIFSRETRRAD